MKRISIFSFVFFLIVSCSNEGKLILLKEKVDVLGYIDLSLSNIDFDANFFQNDASGKVYLFNPSNSTIFLVNIKDLKLEKLGSFPIQNVQGFTFNSSRNTFVFLANDSIVEYNLNIECKNKIACGQVFNGFPTVVNRSSYNILSKENKVFIHYFANDSLSYQSPNFFLQPIEIELDLNVKKFTLLNSYYPVQYQKNCFGLQFAPERIVGSNSKHIFTFAYNDSVFVNEGGELKAYFFGTKRKYEKVSLNFNKVKYYNSSIYTSFLNEVSSYYYLDYLPYTKQYVRKFSMKSSKNKKLKVTTIFYDEQFNYIGETDYKDFGGGLIFDIPSIGVVQFFSSNQKLGIYKTTWHEYKQ